MCCSTQASSAALVLLLLLGQSLAMAPGDEDDVCGVPEYPVYFRVLMDSWRYQRLLPQYEGDSAAPWTTHGDWSSHGMCNSSSVSLCAKGNKENKWIQTQFIDKSLPAPDTYPVKIFVDVTYSLNDCDKPHCHHDLDLELRVSQGSEYTGDDIRPNNVISYNMKNPNGTRQFSFLSNPTSSGFSISLRATEACVTVSRVLVYRYECAGHDRLPTGLSRRPPTQAPDNGSVRVDTYCAEHSHFSTANGQNKLVCLSNGTWLNEQPQCVCDEGYKQDVDTCKGIGFNPADITQSSGQTPTMSVLPKISPPSQNIPAPSTETPDSTSASGTESSTVLSVAVFTSLGGIMGLLTIVVFSIIVAITVAKHKYKSRSKADLCTTTENVAYVSTLKPVARPSGQNPVYEEIYSDALGTGGGAGENQVYEEIHSDALGTGGGDDIGTTENVAYATSTRQPATDSIHSIHKLETAEFEPKTRDEETD